MVWTRLSHPNVLPVLGGSQKISPLHIVTEWMVNGNITDFTHDHPEVNRLYLVRRVPTSYRGLRSLNTPEVYRSCPRIAVPSLLTYHPQPPQTRQHAKPTILLLTTDCLTQENILIDRDFHPRLADYGLPLRLDVVEGGSHHYEDLQYLAPELLDPTSFGLESRVPTKESDVFSFGMVTYQVGPVFIFTSVGLTRDLGTHRTTTLSRSQIINHSRHRYRNTTAPTPRFQRVAFGQRMGLYL